MRSSLLFLPLVLAAAGALFAADPDPSQATKETPFVNSLGMKFVPVPIMGGPTDGQQVLFGVWDTRVQDYEAFVKETNQKWPKPDFEQGPTHPAVNVSWDDAQLFCQWLNARDQAAHVLPAEWGYRLPSDHEWSCAVGIGDRENAAKLPNEKDSKIDGAFPWGNQWPPPKEAGNYAGEEMRPAVAAGKYGYTKDVIAGHDDGFVNTSPVGSFAANRFGLFDLGGNVWQWCQDWVDKKQVAHVLRGASWGDYQRRRMLLSHRYQYLAGARFPTFGFRCVLSVSGSKRPLGDVAAVTPNAPASPSIQRAAAVSGGPSINVEKPKAPAALATPGAPESPSHAPAPAAKSPPPSKQIEPFLEPSLNAVLAPLGDNPQMPRIPVEKLRASLGAGVVTSKTPAQQQIYQYAIAVCDALTNGMDERAQAKAAAIASGLLPSISTGGSIVKTAPLRGWDAGHAGDAIRKKQKDERAYADKQAKDVSNFTDSSAYKAWVAKTTMLRDNAMGLYSKLVQLEAADSMVAEGAR